MARNPKQKRATKTHTQRRTPPGNAVGGTHGQSAAWFDERVREELRNGASPQVAINTGYERAWATILDSNVTTLIAGVALLAFGSGPVRGFAIVHCLGILTSMFSAVMFSRALVNFWYGRQKKLKSVSIGQVWRPDGGTAAAAEPASKKA